MIRIPVPGSPSENRWSWWGTAGRSGMPPLFLVLFLFLLLGWGSPAPVTAGEESPANPVAQEDPWRGEPLDPSGVQGSLLLVGGGRISDAIWERFRELAGDTPRLIVIPTASANASSEISESERTRWQARGFSDVTVLHVLEQHEPEQHEPEQQVLEQQVLEQTGADPWSQAAKMLSEADAVWIQGGRQSRVTDRYLGTMVEKELRALLDRGGVIGGTSAGAAVMSGVMIAGGNPRPRLVEGFDWVPDAIVDQHFSERDRRSRLEAALKTHPERWGIGIDEGTAVVVRSRRLEVLGKGSVTLMLAGWEPASTENERLVAGQVADLTAWRRAARGRTRDRFPPEECADCEVARGALVIVGGGELPRAVVSRFVELAGGPDARIVVLPTALPDPLPNDRRLVAPLTRAGARNVRVLRERDPRRMNEAALVAELHEATGVWFGGGRQWRFVDAYEGTRAHEALRQVLERGGVIGGSSAGASIQAEYLVRGSPLGNHIMMARGYERGLGFLPGTAIDQHFTQRNRSGDLAGVIERYPQLLGIGVDEGTALVVEGSWGEVLGRGAVYFFDAPDVMATSVTAGGRYDLKARRPAVDEPAAPVEITDEEGP